MEEKVEYTDKEKYEYLLEKSVQFSQADVGKFVITRDPKANRRVVPILYLVDRRKTKAWFWTCYAEYAMVFDNKGGAELALRKLKHREHIEVADIKPWMCKDDEAKG